MNFPPINTNIGQLRNIEQALREISENKNILYDPAVVDACLKLLNNKNPYSFEENTLP